MKPIRGGAMLLFIHNRILSAKMICDLIKNCKKKFNSKSLPISFNVFSQASRRKMSFAECSVKKIIKLGINIFKNDFQYVLE